MDIFDEIKTDIFDEVETKVEPTITGVPRYAETEEKIASRRNPYEVFKEELTYKPENRWGFGQAVRPLTAVSKGFQVPLRVGESALASAGLALQRGQPQDIPKDVFSAIKGERMAELGDIPRAVGVPEPISAITGLFGLGGVLRPKSVKNVAKHPIRAIKDSGDEIQAMGEIASNVVRRVSTKLKGFVHGKEWIRTQANSVRNISDKLDDSLGNLYQNFYGAQGIGDVPLEQEVIVGILKKHNVPETLINEIIEQTAGTNNIHKAQAALQILGKRVNDPVWQGIGRGAEFNPKIAAKNSWIDIKRYMRESAKVVNPEAAKQLEQLDGLAHDKIYPTINKYKSIAGKETKPKTSTILDIFSGGRAGIGRAAEQGYIEETPENIKKMSQYLNDPNFQKEMSGLFKDSEQLVKQMKSFTKRQLLKRGVGVGLILGGGGLGVGALRQRGNH